MELNSFVIIFLFMVLAMVLTYTIPAGSYDRYENSAGQTVIDPSSFHYKDQTPVSPFEMFVCVGQAFENSAGIIFCILFAYCFIGSLLKCGVFHAFFGRIIYRLKDKSRLLLPIIMISFGLMGSVAGLAEETFGMFPLCISLAIAMGYDRIVGSAIVYLAVFTGFASATFNPYTIGVAQAIAEVPIYSGLKFRIFCFVIFMGILIVYVMRYADKVKKHPEKSLLVDTPEKDAGIRLTDNKITVRQWLSVTVFVVILFFIIFGAIHWGWYLEEIIGLFLIGNIAVGFINGWGPSKIANEMVEIGSGCVFSMMVIGFSNAISVIMTNGGIIDTVVHGMAGLLKGTSGYFSAILMLVIQNILNFFIPSGPGQAAVSMPIMSSLADATGLSRQLAVLAFQFGDGFSNIFWPTMVCMMCGIIQVPIRKWYKFVTPLFGIMFIAQVVLICVAYAIGY